MNWPTQPTWEKLSFELDLLKKEDPCSLVPLLIGINSLLTNQSPDWCNRYINFLTYELASHGIERAESDRFEILNDFFFNKKGFEAQILGENVIPREDHLLLHPVLNQKQGHPLTLVLIYLHLAQNFEIPIQLLTSNRVFLLKWVRGGRSSYVNFGEGGRLLSEEELLQTLSYLHKDKPDQLTIEKQSSNQILLQYLDLLDQVYLKAKQYQEQHQVLTMLLKIEPNNTSYLGQRALLRKKLGLSREALNDLKRYFSLTERSLAPIEMQRAHVELENLVSAIMNPIKFLH